MSNLWESLKPLHGLNRRSSDSTGGQEYGGWRRNRQRRTGLQGRNGVGRQPVACSTFRPIESHRARHVDRGPYPRPGIVSKQHGPRVGRLTCDNKHATSALRKAEPSTVHDAIRPPVTSLLKSPQNVIHGRSTRQMKHEIDVFDDDPRYVAAVEQFEQLADDRAFPTLDSLLVTGHGEVLARKPGRDDIRPLGRSSRVATSPCTRMPGQRR